MTLRGVAIAGGVLCGFGGLFMAVGTAILIAGGEYRLAIQFVALTAFNVGFATGALRYGSDRVRPRVQTDAAGTTLWPDRLLDISFGIGFLGLVVNFAYVLITWPYGEWSAIPAWLSVTLRIVGVVLAIAMSTLLWGYVRWGASTYLRLTPDGVEIPQGLRVRSSRWDDIWDVTDKPPRARRRSPSSVALVVSEKKALRMSTSMFTPNGAVLREFVDSYWRYPVTRGELVDGTAAQRLQGSLPIR